MSRRLQFGLSKLLLWTALLGVWWGICGTIGMNVFGLVFTTGWLVMVAIVREAVTAMAALAVSVVLGVIAQVMIIFLPALTLRPSPDVLFVSLMSPGLAFVLWLGLGAFSGLVVWVVVGVALGVVDRDDNPMQCPTDGGSRRD